jgi:hypothetical protein
VVDISAGRKDKPERKCRKVLGGTAEIADAIVKNDVK